jgi:hypothetical protein
MKIGKKKMHYRQSYFLMTTMMSYSLFICATVILPITAINKIQVPYAVHPDPHPAECAEADMQ